MNEEQQEHLRKAEESMARLNGLMYTVNQRMQQRRARGAQEIVTDQEKVDIVFLALPTLHAVLRCLYTLHTHTASSGGISHQPLPPVQDAPE